MNLILKGYILEWIENRLSLRYYFPAEVNAVSIAFEIRSYEIGTDWLFTKTLGVLFTPAAIPADRSLLIVF